jgi:class 3 adenylate cyclase/tetratricopeptide (TPR) repeat protein
MRSCLTCGESNSADARFCISCGSALSAICDQCGTDLPEGSRFCPSCGAPSRPIATAGEERKLVTVLFADVEGSTALGERLDPERLKEVMSAFFEAMRAEIEAEGGTIEKFIGDAIMAVFGVPVSHEDDPTRALRAANRMGQELARLNRVLARDHGVELAIRIGVNTGEVVASAAPRRGEGMVIGDAVNVAARLEQSAAAGQVLLAERTARAARGVEIREVGALSLKGKEGAVRAFELIEAAPLSHPGSPIESEVRARGAPLVGRDRELALLRILYDRVVAEARPHLVTIYGESGVGKTRLLEEFAESAGLPGPPLVLTGRCLPYGDGITYWPLGEILRTYAGVETTDPSEVALGKVRVMADRLLSGRAALGIDAEETARALALTVGIESSPAPIWATEPREVRRRIHEAWRWFFSALATAGPTLVAIEDIHWADVAMLDLLEDLAERIEGTVLFVCPSRPELTARRPGWGGGRWSFSGLLLDPLTIDESERMLDFLLAGDDVSRAERTRMLERAGGNPFFLEEIVRHFSDERQAVQDEAGWGAAEELAEIEIPDTVQGVLSARIDLLDPGEKRVLQSAAVVGRTFWAGALVTLSGPEQEAALEETLARLVERGLVTAPLSTSMAGQSEYVFRHVLTRDVAYESLPRRERAIAHSEVASWIEEHAGERRAELAELLAHHFEEAYRGFRDDRRASPEQTEDLRGRAFHYLLLASEATQAKFALENAERYAETALSVAEGATERARAQELLGRVYYHDSRGDLAWSCLKEAVDQLVSEPGVDPQTVARLCAAALEVATRGRGTMRGRLAVAEAAPYFELGLHHAGEEVTEERARLLTCRAFWPGAFRDLAWTAEELRQSREAGEEAEVIARKLGRPDLASAALDGVSTSYLAEAMYGPMKPVVDRRLALVPSLSDPREIGDIFAAAAWRSFHAGAYREALSLAHEGFRRVGSASVQMALYCMDWQALAHFRLGEWDAFFEDVGRLRELLGERRDTPPGFAADHVAVAALLHDVRGDWGAAARHLQVLDWLERTEERPLAEWAACRALILARRGSFPEARAELEGANLPAHAPGRDRTLEALCEVIALQGSWDDAPGAIEEARRWSEGRGLEALSLFALRLEGRAALAKSEGERAGRVLSDAAAGFDRLEAAWEAAVTRLDLARARIQSGRPEEARDHLASIVPLFDRLRSLRELVQAGELLAELDRGGSVPRGGDADPGSGTA